MGNENALQRLGDAGSDELARLLLRAARAVNEQIVEELAKLDHPNVRPAHTAVFAHLDPGGTRAVDLAQRAGITRQAMSILVRELETEGYVALQPDPTDGRAALVQLTGQGDKFCNDAARVIKKAENTWARRLNDPGLATLRSTLLELINF